MIKFEDTGYNHLQYDKKDILEKMNEINAGELFQNLIDQNTIDTDTDKAVLDLLYQESCTFKGIKKYDRVIVPMPKEKTPERDALDDKLVIGFSRILDQVVLESKYHNNLFLSNFSYQFTIDYPDRKSETAYVRCKEYNGWVLTMFIMAPQIKLFMSGDLTPEQDSLSMVLFPKKFLNLLVAAAVVGLDIIYEQSKLPVYLYMPKRGFALIRNANDMTPIMEVMEYAVALSEYAKHLMETKPTITKTATPSARETSSKTTNTTSTLGKSRVIDLENVKIKYVSKETAEEIRNVRRKLRKKCDHAYTVSGHQRVYRNEDGSIKKVIWIDSFEKNTGKPHKAKTYRIK